MDTKAHIVKASRPRMASFIISGIGRGGQAWAPVSVHSLGRESHG